MAAVLVFAGAAQSFTQQAQPAAGKVNLQMPADEVLLDMVVHDNANKPVLDLKPEDLKVTDNDQPVVLSQLRLVSGKQQDEPLITLLFNRPGFQSGKSEEDARQAGKSMREAASRLLKQFSDSGFRFSVMDVWGRLQLQQEFTGDRKAIEKAVTAAVDPGQYGVPVGLNAAETRVGQILQTGHETSGAAVSARDDGSGPIDQRRRGGIEHHL